MAMRFGRAVVARTSKKLFDIEQTMTMRLDEAGAEGTEQEE